MFYRLVICQMTSIYPLVIKHGRGKSIVNGGVYKKITKINGPFSSQPCLMTPEGKSHQIPLNQHCPKVFLWFSCFSYVFLWISYGFPMVSMVFLWFSCGFPMVSYGFPLVFLWFSSGFPMVFLWFSYGFPMVFLWFPMVFLWFSYGFPIDSSHPMEFPLDFPGRQQGCGGGGGCPTGRYLRQRRMSLYIDYYSNYSSMM